jgi:hypothetical protein
LYLKISDVARKDVKAIYRWRRYEFLAYSGKEKQLMLVIQLVSRLRDPSVNLLFTRIVQNCCHGKAFWMDFSIRNMLIYIGVLARKGDTVLLSPNSLRITGTYC